MCERLDIKSGKDSVKLKAAKDEVYLKGFYEGVMLVGECAGMKVIVINVDRAHCMCYKTYKFCSVCYPNLYFVLNESIGLRCKAFGAQKYA